MINEVYSMIIRQENPCDYDEVYSVVKTAFASAKHSDGTEQDLVVRLRQSTHFIPELSLVAQIDKRIAGHIMFTKAYIGETALVALAPLSVLPEFQNKGISTDLILKGHFIAQKLGYPYCVVLGSETYYPRFGYVPAEKFHIQAPFHVPSDNFMAIKLIKNASPVNGTLRYAPEFGI